MPAPHTRVRFGAFEFDPDSLELFRDGVRVPLPPKPAQALAVLVARAGRVVRREELVAALWPAAHVDFDKSLNFTMLQLRRVLGDEVARPRYIETLPRLGYRFVAEIATAAPPVRTPLRAAYGRAAAAVAAVAAAGWLALTWQGREMPPPEQAARVFSVRAADQLRIADRTPRQRQALVAGAILDLERAVSLAPDRAEYWVDLANAHFRLRLTPARLRLSRAAVERAVALAPASPWAHLRQGDLRTLLDWDWAGARASYQTAIDLDPTFAEAHRHLATLELIEGRAGEAVARIEQAVMLEPLSSALHGEAGWTYLYAGDFAGALRYADRALEIDPAARHARECVMYASAGLGDRHRAEREAARLLGLTGTASAALAAATALPLPEYHRLYLASLDRAQQESVERVLALAALGDVDAALAGLDAAIAERVPQALFRLRDPRLQPLHGTPGFQRILARLRLDRVS